MRAAFYERTGPAGVVRVGELPTPEPGAGQVRVRVHAAALNPVDAYLRGGLVAMPLPFPFVTGSDFAGVVDALGVGVTAFRVGDRVWGSNQGLLGRQGTFAEFVCPDAGYCYHLPTNVDYETAAACALTGITAHLGLFHRTNLVAGEALFVNGGAGGVGSMVVRMGKITGARVVCTAGSDESIAVARELGADTVINYKTDDGTAEVKSFTDGRGVGVYYETQPPKDLTEIIDRCAFEARIVVMAGRSSTPAFPNGPFYVKGLQLIGFAMFNAPIERQARAAADIAKWMAAGELRPVIGRRFPLGAAAEAHALQDANTLGKAGTLRGKIVIDVAA